MALQIEVIEIGAVRLLFVAFLFYSPVIEDSLMFRICSGTAKPFLLVAASWLIATSAIQAQVFSDDFSYGGLGDGEHLWEGNSNYNVKYNGDVAQFQLFDWAESGGNTGAAGRLNVAVAERNYIARSRSAIGSSIPVVAPVGVGNTVTISSDFQISITGDALTGGQDGTDDSLFGIQLGNTGNWWDGDPWFDFTIARRSDSTWGVRLGGDRDNVGAIMGSLANSEIGLGDGSGVSTSGWYTMTMVLTDNGATYDATASVAYGGSDVWVSAPIATPYASGTPLFGGYTTGFNDDTGLEIADISPISVGDLGKLSDAMADNFYLASGSSSVPEPTSLALLSVGLISVLARRRLAA